MTERAWEGLSRLRQLFSSSLSQFYTFHIHLPGKDSSLCHAWLASKEGWEEGLVFWAAMCSTKSQRSPFKEDQILEGGRN